jgi:hypothetical protein
MIKATADGNDGKKLIIFGFSLQNVALLMADKPIEFNGQDFGLPDVDFLIFVGVSDDSMTEQFKKHFNVGTFIDRRGE